MSSSEGAHREGAISACPFSTNKTGNSGWNGLMIVCILNRRSCDKSREAMGLKMPLPCPTFQKPIDANRSFPGPAPRPGSWSPAMRNCIAKPTFLFWKGPRIRMNWSGGRSNWVTRRHELDRRYWMHKLIHACCQRSDLQRLRGAASQTGLQRRDNFMDGCQHFVEVPVENFLLGVVGVGNDIAANC